MVRKSGYRCQRLSRGLGSLDSLQNILMKIKKMFLKDDIYSYLTEEMYINYYFPYILNNAITNSSTIK